MQPASFRLAQYIRTAFRLSKDRLQPPALRAELPKFSSQNKVCLSIRQRTQVRFYSQPPEADKSRTRSEASKERDQTSNPPDDSKHGFPTHTQHSTAYSSKNPNELPSHTESRRTDLSKRFSHLMDNVQSNIFTASQRLNDLTGYSGIEALKKSIQNQEELVSSTRQAVKAARAAYSSAVANRSATQREVNDLLQRKHKWSPSDLERFTNLYRSDHANEQDEQRAHDELGRCERAAEEASNALAKSILARYHEEQIWSDKIRQMSTWGTWGLMGVNVLLFLIFQVAVEPWRRKRLVKGFEEKVMEALEKEKADEAPDVDFATGMGDDAAHPTNASAETRLPGVDDMVDEPKLAAARNVVDSIAPAGSGNRSAIEAAIEIVEAAEAIEATRNGDNAILVEDLPAQPSAFEEPKTGYAYYQDAFRELFSEKKLVTTQRDMTTAVLEGAAGGAALMGLLLVLLRPR